MWSKELANNVGRVLMLQHCWHLRKNHIQIPQTSQCTFIQSVHSHNSWLSIFPVRCLFIIAVTLWTEWVCAQSGLTLCDSTDCNPRGSSVHEIFWTRILDWVASSSSRGILPYYELGIIIIPILKIKELRCRRLRD